MKEIIIDGIKYSCELAQNSTKEIAMASSWSLPRGVEIGLIALIVLLVILGLIIGFNKLKHDDEEDENNGKTYY